VAERLADAVSPYLRSHAGNPVDWYPWGDEAFAAARERDVPVLVSIGYATCHWCHVMARESFSDPVLAAYLNEHFVAVKVDREEHPEVDAAYLAAAGVFTDQLGWPLNVFTTPEGRTFHAGTYSPPAPVGGHPSFRQVLEAVVDAWEQRRGELEAMGAQLARALGAAAARPERAGAVTPEALGRVAEELVGYEDRQFGGFGGAPKFPVAPVLLLALALARSPVVPAAVGSRIGGVADRALAAMRDRGLRDPLEGGFFRYAVRREWTEPHYERMLTDNALLLTAYAEAGDRTTASGVVAFLRDVLRRADGTFGSAQDSESEVDGRRSEGGYYLLDAAGRARQPRPAVDAKVLTGWNGLAIGALARAGTLLDEPEWIRLAERAADALLAAHRLPDGRLLRASLDGRPSAAAATLEDYGGLADGLLQLAIAAGRPELAVAGRELIDACLDGERFRVPGGGDPTLAAMGLPGDADPGEGAYPSGATLLGTAAWRLFLLTGEHRYRAAAEATVAAVATVAVGRPISFGGLLALALAVLEPVRQLVVVAPDAASDLVHAARGMPTSVTAVVDEATAAGFASAGFELFEGRTAQDGRPTAYACRDFVCRLPVTEPMGLAAAFA
jgi:uncharacterized protein